MKHTGLIVLLAAALLAACEEKKPYQPPVPRTDKDQTKLFEPQREALDKAKGVEKTLEQAGRDREQAAEKAAR